MRDRGDGERGLSACSHRRPRALGGRRLGERRPTTSSTPRSTGSPASAGSSSWSSRFQGRPGFRASSAFDGTSQPWVAQWPQPPGRLAGVGHAAAGDDLLADARPRARRAAADAGPRRGELRHAAADGRRGRRRAAAGAAARRATSGSRSCAPRSRRGRRVSSGSGARSGSPRSAARGSRGCRCGAPGRSTRAAASSTWRVGGRSVGVRLDATLEDLDAGRPLRFSGCSRVSLPAGETRLYAEPDLLTPYLLRLRSPGTAGGGSGGGRGGLAGHGDPRWARRACGSRSTPRPADPGRGLQPRPARELRRPRPRRTRRSARPSAPPGRCPPTAARSRSRSRRTGW